MTAKTPTPLAAVLTAKQAASVAVDEERSVRAAYHEAVRAAVEDLGVRQVDLAEALGVTPQRIAIMRRQAQGLDQAKRRQRPMAR
jgi:ribosome-binding protein aMBF1 (putative translation factor)